MIEQRHEIPLTTAITKSTPGKGALVESLYRECLSLFVNTPTRTTTATKQRNANPVPGSETLKAVVAIVTDNTTGLFIQLSGIVAGDKAAEGPHLTFGKKFLEESKNPQLANNAIKLWQ